MKIIIRTYEELEQRVNAFSQMTLPLLVLHGPPGTSKSTAVRKMFPHGTHARWVNGTASAFGLFGELRRYRDMPFVLDDLDDAFRDKALIRLMKQVCQTDAVRRISWVTNAIKGTPGDGDDSRSFETSSRVVLIVNDWQKMNRHVGAVGDRAWELEFLPTPQEIHRFVGSWRHEALNADGMPTVAGPVYEYIGDRLDAVSDTSIRQYILATQGLRVGVDWKKDLESEWGNTDPKMLVRRLADDDGYVLEEHRIDRFRDLTGLSRSRYFEIKDSLGLKCNRQRGGFRQGAGRKPNFPDFD